MTNHVITVLVSTIGFLLSFTIRDLMHMAIGPYIKQYIILHILYGALLGLLLVILITCQSAPPVQRVLVMNRS